MNLLIVQASPKKKGGASRFFSRLLRLFLPGVRKETVSLSARQDFQPILELLPSTEAVCLSVPLYVDGLPSHVVEFLGRAEAYCQSHPCRFRLYALCNNGFVEGKQNLPALRMLQAWCEKTGMPWGGGIGIGGGVMLQVLGIVYPHPDWHHSASDGVILFQHRNITRRAVVLPCHPDMHMAFSQQRPTILLGAAFVGHSQRAGVAQPLYAGHDSRFSVCPCRRRIYDIVLSFSWPLPRHTLETGQMA